MLNVEGYTQSINVVSFDSAKPSIVYICVKVSGTKKREKTG